jgi:hypothetical protein
MWCIVLRGLAYRLFCGTAGKPQGLTVKSSLFFVVKYGLFFALTF